MPSIKPLLMAPVSSETCCNAIGFQDHAICAAATTMGVGGAVTAVHGVWVLFWWRRVSGRSTSYSTNGKQHTALVSLSQTASAISPDVSMSAVPQHRAHSEEADSA